MVRQNRKGQSIGEYAILFAVVLGAVVAMQRYVSNRLAGTTKTWTDNYQTSSESQGSQVIETSSDSTSSATASMSSAAAGTLGQTGVSKSKITTPE